MKKSLLILTAAATIVACSKNDTFNDIDTFEAPIGFSKVYIEKGTKAFQYGAYDMTNFETEGNTFAVFGYKTASGTTSKVFGERTGETEGVVVTFGTDWAYTPLRYWDKAATEYNFYAYAPSSDMFTGTVALTANDATTFSITGFQQNTTQPTMIDLMTDLESKASVTNSTTKKIGENDVEFTFKHILSNINILMAVSADLKSDSVNNPVTVDSVEIGAIKMDGTYAYATNKYAWTLASSATAQTFKAQLNSNNVVFDSNELKAISAEITGGGTLPSSVVGTDSVPLLTDLLFVPQALTADEYVIKVKYRIKDEIFHKTISLSSFTKKVNNVDTSLDTWEPGYKYNYVLIIGPTPIYFDVADITGWTDGGTYQYTID